MGRYVGKVRDPQGRIWKTSSILHQKLLDGNILDEFRVTQRKTSAILYQINNFYSNKFLLK